MKLNELHACTFLGSSCYFLLRNRTQSNWHMECRVQRSFWRKKKGKRLEDCDIWLGIRLHSGQSKYASRREDKFWLHESMKRLDQKFITFLFQLLFSGWFGSISAVDVCFKIFWVGSSAAKIRYSDRVKHKCYYVFILSVSPGLINRPRLAANETCSI